MDEDQLDPELVATLNAAADKWGALGVVQAFLTMYPGITQKHVFPETAEDPTPKES